MKQYDKIIIGAGLYGLYSALFCGQKGQSILVLECDPTPFRRATYINQARVHQGYHYPRSISTAMKSADILRDLIRITLFVSIRSLKKYMRLPPGIPGLTASSSKAFAEPPYSL